MKQPSEEILPRCWQCMKVSVTPHFHQHLVLSLFNFKHFAGNVMAIYCGFNLYISNGKSLSVSIFFMFVSHLDTFVWQCSSSSSGCILSCPFFLKNQLSWEIIKENLVVICVAVSFQRHRNINIFLEKCLTAKFKVWHLTQLIKWARHYQLQLFFLANRIINALGGGHVTIEVKILPKARVSI